MYSCPSTSRIREPLPWAMNGGYGCQPNLTVRALLPAPPGMYRLASSKSAWERRDHAWYRCSNVTIRLPHVLRYRQSGRYLVYSACSICQQLNADLGRILAPRWSRYGKHAQANRNRRGSGRIRADRVGVLGFGLEPGSGGSGNEILRIGTSYPIDSLTRTWASRITRT